MPDDLSVQVQEALESKQKLLTFSPHAVEVGAMDTHEEVAGPPCGSINNHGVGFENILLVNNPVRNVKEGRGDARMQTEGRTI